MVQNYLMGQECGIQEIRLAQMEKQEYVYILMGEAIYMVIQ